ncbi:hypothetical protein A2935_02150 [Candidatus Wolfebacteria bacterium RIFCSPLOWO2_01_FULL_47_17b]|uniref:Uncharacterized protein n=1 Tax=Candidatus Wolfebacteria bacterium RIFCSPLOWO2_01_FULL_47_17b TaxID=1802558 RepID=A0A1F8DW95_9BACT|nr:MAG: hypothetical protein A2935_02150 [Candidatus Wolfebacteria bacterium RIFCSPLOWO2_01_FULL_47_17b]
MSTRLQKITFGFCGGFLVLYGSVALYAASSGVTRPQLLFGMLGHRFFVQEPWGSVAWFIKATRFHDEQKIDAAEEALHEAIRLDPYNHPEYWLRLGQLQFEQRRQKEALETVTKVLGLWNEDAINYLIQQKRDILSQLSGVEPERIPRTQSDDLIELALLRAAVAETLGDNTQARLWIGRASSWRAAIDK